MKKLICLSFIVLTTNCVFAQTNAEEHQWRVTLKVVDEGGNPVAGANAGVGYYTYDSQPARIDGITDTNGIFTALHSAVPSISGLDLGFRVEKQGHYTTWIKYDLGAGYDSDKWNTIQTLILKKVVHPIPMYARRAQIEVPVLDKQIGFDLEKYDWIAPYGIGEYSDIVFEAHRRWVSRHDFDATVKISFPNSGDGLLAVSVPPVQGSTGPKVPVSTPLNSYVPELQIGLGNTPIGGWKDDNKNGNYYFRVRTFLDSNGNVKSTLYGKIYGGFTLDPINSKTTFILFTYYLNPTPNDQNVEFDPNRNLFQGLPFIERVKEP